MQFTAYIKFKTSATEYSDISEAEVTIHEGKFHQIKRMFAKRKNF